MFGLFFLGTCTNMALQHNVKVTIITRSVTAVHSVPLCKCTKMTFWLSLMMNYILHTYNTRFISYLINTSTGHIQKVNTFAANVFHKPFLYQNSYSYFQVLTHCWDPQTSLLESFQWHEQVVILLHQKTAPDDIIRIISTWQTLILMYISKLEVWNWKNVFVYENHL